MNFEYCCRGQTIKKFHEDKTARVKCLQGPFGSGKTTACVWEIFFISISQRPDKSRRRKIKWIVVKNTYRQMWTVVMPLWFKVFPQNNDHPDFKTNFNQAKMTHEIELKLFDGSILEMEVFFISADKSNPETFKGINSTAVWFCEASDISPGVINTALTRAGRYPADENGVFNADWYGGIMDTNPPDMDDWLYKMFNDKIFNEQAGEGWRIFKQPSGLSPEAENMVGKSPTYYQDMMVGKTQKWIDIYVHGREGFSMDGKLVFPEYNDDIHCSKAPLIPIKARLIIGVDFGLTPAAIFVQQNSSGSIFVLDEICLVESGAIKLAEAIKIKLAQKFSLFSNEDILIVGDPAGKQRSQIDGISTALDVLEARTGVRAVAAPTNAVQTRFEAVRLCLTRLLDGKPGILIDPDCKMLRKGFNGKYIFRTISRSYGDKTMDVPLDNEYTHIQDCLQYALLQTGQARELIRKPSEYNNNYTSINRSTIRSYDNWHL
jgi:hypothetical protein